MPGPLTRVRVLMVGRDEALLSIRARVLGTISCDTRLAYDLDHARQEITPGADKPRLVLLCHSAGEETASHVRSLALQAGIPTYYIQKLLPPEQLISDVRALLDAGASSARSATGCRKP
jgi:hypothetical protein